MIQAPFHRYSVPDRNGPVIVDDYRLAVQGDQPIKLQPLFVLLFTLQAFLLFIRCFCQLLAKDEQSGKILHAVDLSINLCSGLVYISCPPYVGVSVLGFCIRRASTCLLSIVCNRLAIVQLFEISVVFEVRWWMENLGRTRKLLTKQAIARRVKKFIQRVDCGMEARFSMLPWTFKVSARAVVWRFFMNVAS